MTCQSWYINEIATILFYILNVVPFENRSAYTQTFLSSFIPAYREEFDLAEEELAHIPHFLLYRDLLVYAYTFRIWPDENTLKESEAKFRKKLSDSIDRRLNPLN